MRKFDKPYASLLFFAIVFRLDRPAFHTGTHARAEAYHRQPPPETMAERLRAVLYLNSVAFNFDLNNPPCLDRTAFSCRARTHRFHRKLIVINLLCFRIKPVEPV